MNTQLIQSGGVQAVAQPQIVYLDFDGEVTRYNGELLTIDQVTVEDSGLTAERISNIVSLLNASYAERNVIFVTERPAGGVFSTVYVGKTSAFDEYGNFAGLAETIDSGNHNPSDNAFVNLDATVSDHEIIKTISHEVDHIVFGSSHQGEGLGQYAYTQAYFYNQTYTGVINTTSHVITLQHYNSSDHSSQVGSYSDPVYTSTYYNKAQNVMITLGSMAVCSGGVANNTIVTEAGRMVVYSGGVANDTIISYTSSLSGLYFYGTQRVSSGGVVNSTTINSGYQYVDFGGVANSTTINGCYQFVDFGGVANNTVVNSGGTQYCSNGGVAKGTTINYGGACGIFTYLGESAVLIEKISGGAIVCNVSGLVITGTMSIGSGGIANVTTLLHNGRERIFSGGVANSTTIIGGVQYASSGGVANATTVNSGHMVVDSGGVAHATIINSGYQVISSGGVAHATIVNSGHQVISSGGVANSTVVNSGGTQTVSRGEANDTVINSGGRQLFSKGGVANNTIINSGGYQSISSGGMAASTTISGGWQYVDNEGTVTSSSIGGIQNVSSGGTATDTTINFNGLQTIYSSGMVIGTTINSGGIQNVSSRGAATSTTIYTGGIQNVSSGGAATSTIINSGGIQNVFSRGTATSTTIFGGWQSAISEGTVTSSAVGGWQYVSSGGMASKTEVHLNGTQTICAWGSAYSTKVSYGGILQVTSTGTMDYATVHSGGSMIADFGSVLRGKIVLGGTLLTSGTDGRDAHIVFMVRERKTTDSYIIDDIARISGASYSIIVGLSNESGTYILAEGAAYFKLTITVGDGMLDYGTLTANGKEVNYDGRSYQLVNSNGILSLDIGNASSGGGGGGGNTSSGGSGGTDPVDVRTNLLSNGHSQIVAWDSAGGKVGYVATNGEVAPPWMGIWEWGAEEAAMWKVVAAGRFSANVEHDGILLYNGIGNTFAAWTDLGQGDYGYVSLCHVDGNFQTLGLANFDNNGLDDVIIYDENGSFGIVSDAAAYHDVWHVEDAATNVQQVIGAGYFGNADGRSDILVKKTDENAYFLWHNEDPTFNTWNWSQTYIGSLDDDWSVAAIGDFQGDGVEDIIMWQKSTGYMYAWEDGKASSQRWVGQLNASQWEVAAVGDYNGDGKEDLLLRELVSGWGGVGYWASADASNWTDLNARIETDMESKFAVVA